MTQKAIAYLLLLIFLAAYISILEFPKSVVHLADAGFWILVGASFLGGLYEVQIFSRYQVSASMVIGLASIFLGGFSLALPIILISVSSAEFFLRYHRYSEDGLLAYVRTILFNVSQIVLAAAMADAARQQTGFEALEASLFSAAAIITVSLAYILTNAVLVSIIVHFQSGLRLIQIILSNVTALGLQSVLAVLLAVTVAFVYSMNPLYTIVVFVLILLSQTILKWQMETRQSFKEFAKRLHHQLLTENQIAQNHLAAVVEHSRNLAKALKLAPHHIQLIEDAAGMHDFGAILPSGKLIRKVGLLTLREQGSLSAHPAEASKVLLEAGGRAIRSIARIIRHEHENYDGSGFPDGLKNDEIPLESRILAIATAYVAFTRIGAYQPFKPERVFYNKQEGIQKLREMSGRQLDPSLVETFIDVLQAS